ncbi:hypothetical protein [Shewanella frigidimarina]|uniref:Uncharacterized protein n=1 Tax=Shewanella frigidimarina TaxID=56812 RepID=A0A106C1P6_SHEFR|nr:hypothetical protein [Shewanella frigidimarina]KVX02626.1 hypothetical protein AWJ07_13030 [Shewanella frigidimarina]
MSILQSYYFTGFILFSAVLNAFIENETIAIKLLCLVLLFSTFVFASLYHNLRNKVAKNEGVITE